MSDSSFTKFDFNHDFFEVVPKGGAAIKAPTAPKPKAPKTFKEAAEQGYQKGLAQGLAEGQATAAKTHEQKFQQQAQELAQATTQLQQAHTTALVDLEHSLLGLYRYALGRIVGHAQQCYGDDILQAHIKDLLQEAQTKHQLTLKLNPDATPLHQEIIAGKNSATQQPNLRVEGDSTLGPVDLKLEWVTGGLEKSIPQLFARLDKILQSAGAITPRQDFSPTDAATVSEQDRIAALLGDDDDLVPELQEPTEEATTLEETLAAPPEKT